MTDRPAPRPAGPRARRRSDDVRRIRDLLRDELTTLGGTGEVLPDERLLSLRFGASRNAVRDALDLLRAEGLVERRQGSGTRVVALPVVMSGTGGFPGAMADRSRVRYRMLWCYAASVTDHLAGVLDVEPGDPIAVLERLTLIDDSPVALWTSYFRLADGESMAEQEDGTSASVEMVARVLDREVSHIDHHYEAVLADESVAGLLQVSDRQPLMRVERRLIDADGSTITIGYGRVRGVSMFVSVA